MTSDPGDPVGEGRSASFGSPGDKVSVLVDRMLSGEANRVGFVVEPAGSPLVWSLDFATPPGHADIDPFGAVKAFVVRFEQRCNGIGPALRGTVSFRGA